MRLPSRGLGASQPAAAESQHIPQSRARGAVRSSRAHARWHSPPDEPSAVQHCMARRETSDAKPCEFAKGCESGAWCCCKKLAKALFDRELMRLSVVLKLQKPWRQVSRYELLIYVQEAGDKNQENGGEKPERNESNVVPDRKPFLAPTEQPEFTLLATLVLAFH
ncbi:hypothetical protein MHYP_G00109530 [Metynnis hypsauchen]